MLPGVSFLLAAKDSASSCKVAGWFGTNAYKAEINATVDVLGKLSREKRLFAGLTLGK